jgi:hypothetical protein
MRLASDGPLLVDGADHAVGEDHALGNDVIEVDAADVGEAEEAVGVDVADHEADLVHMGGDHHLGSLAPLDGDQVAQGVHG